MQTPQTTAADPSTSNEHGIVRPNDPETSHLAAGLQTNGRRAGGQMFVYEYLLRKGATGGTDDEIRDALQHNTLRVSKSGPATRRKELQDAGWVKPRRDHLGDLVRRPSNLGGAMQVWVAVPEDEWVQPPAPASAPPAAAHDHEAGMVAARRIAGWEIGDTAWAGIIVDAYLNPERIMAALDAEGAPR